MVLPTSVFDAQRRYLVGYLTEIQAFSLEDSFEGMNWPIHAGLAGEEVRRCPCVYTAYVTVLLFCAFRLPMSIPSALTSCGLRSSGNLQASKISESALIGGQCSLDIGQQA